MGDIKKVSKSFSTPSHPWIKTRIDDENKIIAGYGLKKKREIWKAEGQLKKFRSIASDLIGETSEESAEKVKELVAKLNHLGVLPAGAGLEDILSLNVEQFLDRSLQTLVYKKGIANNPRQARQFILHGHIALKGRRHTSPRTLVTVEDEKTIAYIGPARKAPKPGRAKPTEAPVAEEKEALQEDIKTEAPKEEAPAEREKEDTNNEKRLTINE